MRALLIGLDAACESVLDPLLTDDVVPNIAEILDGGLSSPMESQIPPWTASAWCSMYTGMNPAKHGVYDFLSFDGYDWDVVNRSDVGQRMLWEYLDEHGFTSVVINAPVTHPIRPFDGALVPGYLAPEEADGHPEGIIDEVRSAIGEYRIYAERETDDTQDKDTKFNDYRRLTQLRGEAFRYLTDRFEPDFGFIQFQKTDAVFHDFPGDDEKVREIYREVDDQIGQCLDACDPSNVILVSDHGIGRYKGYEFRVNEHLRSDGYVESTTEGRGVPSWFQMKDEKLVETDEDSSQQEMLKRIAAISSRFGLTYQRGKQLLDMVGLTDFVGRHVSIGAVYAASEVVDYSESAAYYRSPSELGVRINLKGREPNGRIDTKAYDEVRTSLIECLRSARTPDGEPVFDRVGPREEFFEGEYLEAAPDIVTIPTNFDHSLSGLLGDTFASPEPYNHKRYGIFGATGKNIQDDVGTMDPHLFDVAPTVLSLFEISPDELMDGSVLPVVPALEAKHYEPFDQETRVRTDENEVVDRLSDLGYLE